MNQLSFISSGHPAPILACGEHPQARMEKFGVTALSDTELIATFLQGSGTRPDLAVAMASRLIAQAGSVAGLTRWTPHDFQRFRGIGRSKGLQLGALLEIGRRMTQAADKSPVMNRPELIAEHFRSIVTGLDVEKFWVACLNRRNRLKKMEEITSGTAMMTLAHPREVYRAAIQHSATGIVCIHNHPSGDPSPSAADIQITRQLREAARTVDIELVDHIIIGRTEADPAGRGFYSFREAGVI